MSCTRCGPIPSAHDRHTKGTRSPSGRATAPTPFFRAIHTSSFGQRRAHSTVAIAQAGAVAPCGAPSSTRFSSSNPLSRRSRTISPCGMWNPPLLYGLRHGSAHAEVVSQQRRRRGGALLCRVRQHQEIGIREEDQPSIRTKDPSRFRDPAIRVAPDRGAVDAHREVE